MAEEGDPAGGLHQIAGLRVGHFTETRRPTGCTVVLADAGATCGVDVRGGAPGTRETDLLDPVNTVGQVHGVLLAGGSAFGLEAATGVMRVLEEAGIGFATSAGRVPIVTGAVLFDLGVGDGRLRPDAAAGEAAARSASAAPAAEGSVGAGAGATVGKLFGTSWAMTGGLGCASFRLPGGALVAALVVVNAVGDVVDPEHGTIVAGARAKDGGLRDSVRALLSGERPSGLLGENTTLAVVATDACLTKAEATKVAQMAHDGLARTIQPAHTPWDGDTIFALATCRHAAHADPGVLGIAAAEVVSRAVLRAVRLASSVGGLPAARDLRRA